MDKNEVIRIFKKDWLSKADDYVHTPKKLQFLIPEIKNYVCKNGIKDAKGEITLIISYIRDISTGKYSDYNGKSLLMLVAGMIYLLTPLDIVPDVLPLVGFADDAAVITWLFKEFREELDHYRNKNI
ncbi:DUF1232 domain-containing protein [Parabacteroides sp. AD58]|uniref:DUF1232 domain-containing protein n=1 Tax=Parabacteroides absconsus TaxID=2951805 RepID=A0ABZ2IHL8_9BACT|nr:DUF1232 domain-containing protein [Parabacteroides sp. AD58]MCM6902614.1 DUF1232 domain-containing protein [Parabacteroides sp. AD58]